VTTAVMLYDRRSYSSKRRSPSRGMDLRDPTNGRSCNVSPNRAADGKANRAADGKAMGGGTGPGLSHPHA
jgi:hypothetical protein